MVRVIERNSREETCADDLRVLKEDLRRSGHKDDVLEEIEPQAIVRATENKVSTNYKQPGNTLPQLVFSVNYFKDIGKLKSLVKGMENDIKGLCGDIRVVFAMRKHASIGNIIVRNRKLSENSSDCDNSEDNPSQKCNARGCLTCKQILNNGE